MLNPFIILCLQTLGLWALVVFLHRKKEKFTIIPLFAYIGILTILTHNFTDLEFAVSINGWVFLISSFSFFTTLMFGTLFLYLFEGPRAGRLALRVIVFTSAFYIAIVYLLGLQVDTAGWVQLNPVRAMYYFWSVLAIVIDVFFLALAWEVLSKIRRLGLVSRVFLVVFSVFALDALIFVSGAFGGTDLYLPILRSNLVTRLILSILGAPIMAYFLKLEGFSEEKRNKPKEIWEIFNFRSDLESRISTLEGIIESQEAMEEKLRDAKEKYELVISGVGAGIWDLDVRTNKISWSPKFYKLLGYESDEFDGSLDGLRTILHPEDADQLFTAISRCFKENTPLESEVRLKLKSDKYRWFLFSGITKYDRFEKPIRMVGSIIDISGRKEAEAKLKDKISELTKFNDAMLGRELKMIELKKEIDSLKKEK